MNAENSPHTCPQCAAPLPPEAPHGLCPKCLLAGVAAATEGAPHPVAPALEEIAAAFPQLEVQALIGAGGMGAVYRARQPQLERLVALKVLPAVLAERDPAFAERFMREGRLLARLGHPNIVSVHDFGQAGAFYYLVMEYVDGVNLREAMQAGRFTPEQALGLVPHICEALQYAHDEGVLHRDIKPENILLDAKGRVKLADFGIAKLADERVARTVITGTGAQLGTPAYMAPEQIERPSTVDHRADIYSLGVVFYEMLTGELPLGRFAAPSKKTPMDARIDDIVLRALAKERELRQQSATEMKTQVEQVADTPAVGPDDWMIRCDTCGRTSTLAAVGGMRMGAASIGKRTLIRCSQCGKLRMALIAKLKDLPPGTVPVAPDPSMAPQWPLWKIALVIAALSLPIALLITGLAIPAVQRAGGPLWPGILPLVIIPAGAFCFAMALGWFYRWVVRIGAPRWLATVLLLVALLIVPPAGCVAMSLVAYLPWRVSNPVENPRPVDIVTAVEAPFVAHLPQGTVELVAVAPHPSAGHAWWRMDGGLVGEVPFRGPGSRTHPQSGQRAFEFVIRTRDLPEGAGGVFWQIDDAVTWTGIGAPESSTAPHDRLAGYDWVAAALPRSLRQTNVRVGFATASWHTLLNTSPVNSIGTEKHHAGKAWKISAGRGVETKEGDTVVVFSCSPHHGWQARVSALLVGGEVAEGTESRINEQSEWRFRGVSLARIEQFLVQIRPIQWVEFRGVALAPATGGAEPQGPASPPSVTSALHDQAIRLARERLEETRQRVAAGVMPPIDEALAQMELAIAEARGDAVKIATAKVVYHEERSKVMDARMQAGLATNDERSRAEADLLAAKGELETARRSAPLKQ